MNSMGTDLTVIPAQAGIQKQAKMATMDPGLRRDDEIDCLNGNYA